jgi:hypothetical protein
MVQNLSKYHGNLISSLRFFFHFFLTFKMMFHFACFFTVCKKLTSESKHLFAAWSCCFSPSLLFNKENFSLFFLFFLYSFDFLFRQQQFWGFHLFLSVSDICRCISQNFATKATDCAELPLRCKACGLKTRG